jgi:hypothetical protein
MLRTGPVTLRLADATDRPALESLAQLDCRALPPGPHLIAERDGRPDAALSLHSGELVANPFRHTAELCDLLRHHAVGILKAPADRRRRARPGRPILDTA